MSGAADIVMIIAVVGIGLIVAGVIVDWGIHRKDND